MRIGTLTTAALLLRIIVDGNARGESKIEIEIFIEVKGILRGASKEFVRRRESVDLNVRVG